MRAKELARISVSATRIKAHVRACAPNTPLIFTVTRTLVPWITGMRSQSGEPWFGQISFYGIKKKQDSIANEKK